MRIIHTSDLHLGTTIYGTEDPATGINRRVYDFFKAFDQVVDYTINKKADVLLLCGDTFKDISPSSTILKMFANRIYRLSSEGVKTVMLLGNHDSAKTVGRAAPQEIFEELKLPGVHVFAKPDFIDLKSRDGMKLRVFALPYRHPIHLAAKLEKAETRVELDRNALLAAFQSEIKRVIEIFTNVGKKDATLGILAAHLFVEGARKGAEHIYIVGEEYSVPSSMLQSDAFDYVALGHIHSHQVIPGIIPTVYAGSLERIDFSEADEQKGFIDIIYEGGQLSWNFIPIETRRMVKLEVDCTKVKDIDKHLIEAIEKPEIKDSIVRLIIKTKPEIQVNQNLINEKLAPAFWHQVIYEKITEKQNVPTTTSWGSLNPHETLIQYLRKFKLSDEDRELRAKLGNEIVDEVLSAAEKS